MVTSIRKGARGHLYIEEWMAEHGLSDEDLGRRMGVSRTTVWRWRTQQWRLNPGKIANLAEGIGLESPQDLYRIPSRPSIDGILDKAPDDIYHATVELARRLVKRAS